LKPGTQKEHTKEHALCAAKCSTQGSPVKDTAAQAESISLTGKSILIKAVKLLRRSSVEKKTATKQKAIVFVCNAGRILQHTGQTRAIVQTLAGRKHTGGARYI
jgi:hypothetical protein